MTSKFKDAIPPELRINVKGVVHYLALRLKAYVKEYSGRENGVLGLSGGVDSAVVAFLAAKALGPGHTYFYLLPSDSTPPEDLYDARAVIRMLKIPKSNFREFSIDEYVKRFSEALNGQRIDTLGLGNIKARVRMVLLHTYAHVHGGLVLGTGDKSEITIGYFTKYGDGGVDVLPIGDLYKTQVRQLAEGVGIPERVYRKPPSPGLWLGQSAESELGISYFTLDQILYRRFDLWWDEQSVASDLGIALKTVKRIIRQVKKTQHKRSNPEIFRMSFRSHGSDWRYPREWD